MLSAFYVHTYVAHEQAAAFDKCINELPNGALLILTDFSMNYGHTHQDAAQQEWCEARARVVARRLR